MYSLINLENYISYLLRFINQLIENIVPWSKPALEYNYK